MSRGWTGTGDLACRAALMAAILGLLPACGSGSEHIVPLESASLCGAGWETIMTAPPDALMSPLVYRDGVLYYSLKSSQTPLGGDGDPHIFVRPAVTPDAVYFIAYYNQIEIVRVPR